MGKLQREDRRASPSSPEPCGTETAAARPPAPDFSCKAGCLTSWFRRHSGRHPGGRPGPSCLASLVPASPGSLRHALSLWAAARAVLGAGTAAGKTVGVLALGLYGQQKGHVGERWWGRRPVPRQPGSPCPHDSGGTKQERGFPRSRPLCLRRALMGDKEEGRPALQGFSGSPAAACGGAALPPAEPPPPASTPPPPEAFRRICIHF